MAENCGPAVHFQLSDSQSVKIFEIAQKQSTDFCGVAIESTEQIESDTHVCNLYYGKELFNFRFEIQETIHKVHLFQLYRSIYKSSIFKKPYIPDELVQLRHEGQSDEVRLEENHEAQFNLPDFQRMCPFSSASFPAIIKNSVLTVQAGLKLFFHSLSGWMLQFFQSDVEVEKVKSVFRRNQRNIADVFLWTQESNRGLEVQLTLHYKNGPKRPSPNEWLTASCKSHLNKSSFYLLSLSLAIC